MLSRRQLRAAALASALGAILPGALASAGFLATPQAAAATATNVYVDASTSYQRIDGFGASEAFGKANAVMNLAASEQQQVFNDLYSTTSGAGLTILRNLIPSDSNHTIEPTAPSGPTATPTYRSLGTDWGQEWFTQQAKASGVRTVYADAWSAPGFMKTNGSESNGGTLCGVPNATCGSGDWRQAYANYLVQYLKDYKADGINIDYVGFENEPNFVASYSSMAMSGGQSANFADVLGPTLAGSGLSTKLACCDPTGYNVAPSYTSAITSDSTAKYYVQLFTSHGYSGAPVALATDGKPSWETEWESSDSFDPAWDDGSGGAGMLWAQRIYSGLTRANLNAFLYWWGAADTSANSSLINISGSTVQTTGRLWAFAGFARFVRPGSTRVGASTTNSSLDVAAFRNPAGQTVLVVINKATSAQAVGVGLSGMTGASAVGYLTDSGHTLAQGTTLSITNNTFSATVPARSMETYVISSGSRSGYVRFQNRATGLDIDGAGRTSNGSNAGQWANSSSYNQQWRIVPDGSYVRLENRATGLYLDGMDRTSNGSLVGQWSSSSSSNQQWLETSENGYVRFQNRATGLYIDGEGWTSNGSNLGQWGNSSSHNQQWQIVPE